MKLPSLRLSVLTGALAATTALNGLGAVAGIAWGSTPAALAQAGPPGGGRGGGRRFGEMLVKLGLNDAQKARIKGIMKSARDQNQNVTDPEQRRANFRAAFAKVEDVLTPAQRDKLKQLRAQMTHDHPAS
jgi:Spy/CpxP family protein refolding chaperone